MTAVELLVALFRDMRNPDKAVSLFADDAAIELPYLASMNATVASFGAGTE
jgi:hypothetical protein